MLPIGNTPEKIFSDNVGANKLHQVEYVLVFKLSRFGRNAADVLNSLQLMQDFGVNLICVEDEVEVIQIIFDRFIHTNEGINGVAAYLNNQIQSIRQEQISSENVYPLLSVFDELYADPEPTEKRDLMRAIIEHIDLYPEQREDGCWVRNIVFNFPVPVSGVLLKELPLENATMLETVVLLSNNMKQSIK